MAASYLTTADVDAVISVRTRLFEDTSPGDGSGYSATFFTRAVELASAIVKSAAHSAGYTSLGDSTTDEQVIAATLGQFLVIAYNRKQQAVPPEFFEAVNLATGIRDGSVPLTSLTVSSRAAVGGVEFSDVSESTSSRHQVMSRAKLTTY